MVKSTCGNCKFCELVNVSRKCSLTMLKVFYHTSCDKFEGANSAAEKPKNFFSNLIFKIASVFKK